jgi:hypothetical protein
MCRCIQYRKHREEYVCVRIDENGLEEEVTRGTADEMVAYLHEHGLGYVSRDLVKRNIEYWCRNS